ncbi:periplasmic binding protein-like II [Anaeromyces robustus]|uniref:Periplasmic binding protein-like II n=1 Tax=Anaeromyces robustus TaxID=1754192 RepID=A0A1Y1XBT5_9FUNG|nr:periplasmic binding protein-like II [Anaeromyces robustus]|eukprot:ORX83208.1 periplasmic binding protein-like II [Anaeromyces robustus]
MKNIYPEITSTESFVETLSYLMNTKSNKYDLIIFDTAYSNFFGKNLYNLSDYLPDEITKEMEQFINGTDNAPLDNFFQPPPGADFPPPDPNSPPDMNFKPTEIYSLPLYVEYSVLYSNTALLETYGKNVPKTWDELIETAHFIEEEEKKLDNEIYGFAVDMTDTEEGFNTFYEYIYSFRNNATDPFPTITDPVVINALEKLKELKSKLNNRGLLFNNRDLHSCLNSPKCLFVKTWNNVKHSEDFSMSLLPGVKEGISSSCVGQYNLGMNRHITDEKKEIVGKVVEYITSIDFQSKNTLQFGLISAMDVINSDCDKYEHCTYFKSVQSVSRPYDISDDYIGYSRKFRGYILQYLNGDIEASTCVEKIKYITMTFYEENQDLYNRIFMTIVGVSDLAMLYFYFLAFTKKHIHKFKLLSKFHWFLYMFGSILIMSHGFLEMGELTDLKCRIKPFIFSFGFTLCNTILLIRLIVNYPESNRNFVQYCDKHFSRAILYSFVVDVILNLLVLIKPYYAAVVADGAITYTKCKISGAVGITCMGLIYCFKFLILISMIFFVFIEWNIKEFKHDIHYSTGVILISLITFVFIFLSNHMKSGGYATKFLFPALIYYIYGFTSFAIYFISRFFTSYNSHNSAEEIVKKAIVNKPQSYSNHKESNSSLSTRTSNHSNSLSPTKKGSFADHIINLHNNAEEIKKSSELSLKNSNHASESKLNSRKNSNANSLSVDNIRNFEESISMTRRASQITAIPENKIADSFCSNSDQDIHESSNFSKIRSCDNINPGFNRTNRMNSIPGKMFLGMKNMRSYDNFPNNNNESLIRKPSTRSVSNNNINTNEPPRKCSTSNISANSLTNINEEKDVKKENEVVIVTQASFDGTSTDNKSNSNV